MFPHADPDWCEVREFLRARLEPWEHLVAPNDFLEYFPGVFPPVHAEHTPVRQLRYTVLHKGLEQQPHDPNALPARRRRWLRRHAQVALENAVFQVWCTPGPPTVGRIPPLPDARAGRTAILVTTCERPAHLRRTLASLVPTGLEILVVDDGSGSAARRACERIAGEFAGRLRLLCLPANRGLPAALNAGLAELLADPEVAWVSVFQDDCELRDPAAMHTLARVQHARQRPLLTGVVHPLHPAQATARIGGHAVQLQHACNGPHLHAHRSYWQAVLPVPTPYLGAPKRDRGRPGEGSGADWWIGAWSRASAPKTGRHVVAVPGLAATFDAPGESTWA